MKKVFQGENFTGIALAIGAFGIYLSTLAPSVGSMDSGELAAVASTLGIAHPTGYPLFTLLGWAVSHLPLGGRIVWKLNLFAALLCSVALFFFHKFFLNLLSEKSQRAGADLPDRIAAALAVLILGFSRTYWLQAVSIEVYALHLLFLSLLLPLFLRFNKARAGYLFAFNLFAFVLGLSFTNHLMTILLAPAFLFLYFGTNGFGRVAWTKIAGAVVPFLLGLSLYLYLPLRAAQSPVLNWGNPVTWEKFWWHVSARQFQPLVFSSWEAVTRQLSRFLAAFPSEFGWVPFLLAFTGIARLFRKDKRMLVFTLLLFFTCLMGGAGYDIPDPGANFLLAYIVTAIWIAFGIRMLRKGVVVLCGALPFFPLLLNYPAVDQSRNYVLEDYARNMLEPLAQGAVLLSDEETSFYFTLYYLQQVEGLRPDITVLGYRALGLPWYYKQLERGDAGIVRASRPEIEAYLKERDNFDRGRKFDSIAYGTRFVELVQGILQKSYETRPVYITPAIEPAYVKGFRMMPDGLALRLFRDSLPQTFHSSDFSFRPIPPNNPAGGIVIGAYAAGYLYQGLYQAGMGDTSAGIVLFQKALAVNPDFQEAHEFLAAWK